MRLSFHLQTNLVVPLPMSSSTKITTISLHSSNVWVGTAGEGLIKYDASTRQSQRWTVNDGLANNSIASSQVQGDRLWIGYIRGIGFMDLSTKKITTFTASIADGVAYNQTDSNPVKGGQPPRGGVGEIVTGPSGEVFFETANSMLNRYRTGEQIWDIIPTRKPAPSAAWRPMRIDWWLVTACGIPTIHQVPSV